MFVEKLTTEHLKYICKRMIIGKFKSYDNKKCRIITTHKDEENNLKEEEFLLYDNYIYSISKSTSFKTMTYKNLLYSIFGYKYLEYITFGLRYVEIESHSTSVLEDSLDFVIYKFFMNMIANPSDNINDDYFEEICDIIEKLDINMAEGSNNLYLKNIVESILTEEISAKSCFSNYDFNNLEKNIKRFNLNIPNFKKIFIKTLED